MTPKPAIQKAMADFITAREISGAVTLVADGQNIFHLSADGLADIENQTPMALNSIFWIALMTKPVTGTAVMMMQEEGKLSVDDPVSNKAVGALASAGESDILIKQAG